MDRFYPDRNNELTPSHHPDYQDANPIKPADEFIVTFNGNVFMEKPEDILKSIFNKHSRAKGGKGAKPSMKAIPFTQGFVIKGVSWGVVNELRAHPRVDSFGPNSKIRPF